MLQMKDMLRGRWSTSNGRGNQHAVSWKRVLVAGLMGLVITVSGVPAHPVDAAVPVDAEMTVNVGDSNVMQSPKSCIRHEGKSMCLQPYLHSSNSATIHMSGDYFDEYHIRWSRPGRAETPVTRHGTDRYFTISPARSSTTYRFAVQACTRGMFGDSCSGWTVGYVRTTAPPVN